MSRPRPLCHWPLATLATALLACSSPHDTGTDLGSDTAISVRSYPKTVPVRCSSSLMRRRPAR
jgi:hypothetical protein